MWGNEREGGGPETSLEDITCGVFGTSTAGDGVPRQDSDVDKVEGDLDALKDVVQGLRSGGIGGQNAWKNDNRAERGWSPVRQ